MDKAEFIPVGFFMLAFLWMALMSTILSAPYDKWLGSLGMLIMVGGVFFQDMAARLKVADFQHLAVTECPGNKRYHLYFTDRITKKIDRNRFKTRLFLGIPYQHPTYGKVDHVDIYHSGSFKRRIKLEHGYAYFYGMEVKHGHTDNVTLYSYEALYRVAPTVYMAKETPKYELITASGDYPLMAEYVRKAYPETYEVETDMEDLTAQ